MEGALAPPWSSAYSELPPGLAGVVTAPPPREKENGAVEVATGAAAALPAVNENGLLGVLAGGGLGSGEIPTAFLSCSAKKLFC